LATEYQHARHLAIAGLEMFAAPNTEQDPAAMIATLGSLSGYTLK
jgi:hypothetical protein